MVKGGASDLFRIENITKVFGYNFVFNNVSLSIKSGEILGIIGKSGSGKTTFLNMLIGLIKPEKGDILYRDMHLINSVGDNALTSVFKNPKTLKKMYGFASQKPSFYPNLTALENLMYFGSLYNIPKQALIQNAESLLKLVDLYPAKNLISKSMSGGMQRRLDIACSLIHDPKLLILDEPTSDLDLVLSNKIWDILRAVNKKGTTIIVVSHNISDLENFCNRLVLFKDSKIAAIGSPEEIKKCHLVEESILLHSKPGKYKKILSSLSNKTTKSIKRYEIKGGFLFIDSINTGPVLRELIKVLDKQKEEILEIEIKKPSLDKVFVKIQANKIGETIKKSNKQKSNKKHPKKQSKKEEKSKKASRKKQTARKKKRRQARKATQ